MSSTLSLSGNSRSGYSSSSMQQISSSSSARRISKTSLGSGRRAPSVYGGAGGYDTRISRSSSIISLPGEEWSLSTSEKQTMQNLNNRLATYLDKVRSLELANSQLELKIREFYETRTTFTTKDMSVFYSTIADIRKQIKEAFLSTARLTLQVDNARLAAEDFRIKYEAEYNMRQMVEADVAGLKKVVDDLTLSKADLEMQAEGLTEELTFLKKDHTEEMHMLQVQQSGSVNVEVDAAHSADLAQKLLEMREQYEALVQKNHKDMETWFQSKTETLKTQMHSSTTEIKTSKGELSDLRRTYQSLEIEAQGLQTQREYSEINMEEVKARFGQQLSKMQVVIDSLQAELQQLRIDTEHQGEEYRLLLDIKMRLEMEIAEYRRLLDGYLETQVVTTTKVEEKVEKKVVEEEHGPHVQKRVKVIVEEIVDGKVVNSSTEENIQDVSLPY
ncbi:keratin, type I cytoskeletal 19 [Amia ocellicauda]|uniref:keratin, type I cytoskeletal 19 n=1 Tax=Amia ocellicauda TaxID=2972642 RepID=UPI0034648801